jgi:hypothetical protein
MRFKKTWLVGALAAYAAVVAAPAFAQEKLTVWWAKGFYKGEDDAFLEAVKSSRPSTPRSKSICRSMRRKKVFLSRSRHWTQATRLTWLTPTFMTSR